MSVDEHVGPSSAAAHAVGAPVAEIEFEGVAKEFLSAKGDPFIAVQDISLRVDPGTFVCVIGPSGCGKSTLLNMAAGLMKPTVGTVRQRGSAIEGVNADVGYLTQQNNLLPWRTVADNVGIALEVRHVPKRERRERVRSILDTVGLSAAADRYPSQLSGGMQKRAALARVLVYEPDTLLMDEPFGPLDAQLRLTLQRELLSLWEQRRKTVIFITHDLEEAILMADRVIVFGQAPGRVIHVEDVGLSRPRDLVHLRSDPQFNSIWERLWTLLEPQLNERA